MKTLAGETLRMRIESAKTMNRWEAGPDKLLLAIELTESQWSDIIQLVEWAEKSLGMGR